MNRIDKIVASKINDSRGKATLRVKVFSGNISAGFDVPSGASTGKYEAIPISANAAIDIINDELSNILSGIEVTDQKRIDEILLEQDETRQKSKLGGNSTIGISVAVCKVGAMVHMLKTHEYLKTLADIKPSRRIPYMYMNLINGGLHAKSKLVFQEYHVVPKTDDIADGIAIGKEIQGELTKIIQKELGISNVQLGDEGGCIIDTDDIKLPLEFLKNASKKLGHDVMFAIDVAASSFYKDEKYSIGNNILNSSELSKLYKSVPSHVTLVGSVDGEVKLASTVAENPENLRILSSVLLADSKFVPSQQIPLTTSPP